MKINSTNVALRMIKDRLKNGILTNYNVENVKLLVDQVMDMHGMGLKHLDIIKFILTIILNNINDVSIDDNSNKSNCKSILSIHQLSMYLYKKVIGFSYLYDKMKSLYGKKEADRLSLMMYDMRLGLSDSTNILKPYCYAMDASRIVTLGFKNIPLLSRPVKHIGSYVSILSLVIHQMSMHLAGAIAISTLFLDVAHIALYHDKIDLRLLKTSKKYRKLILNEFQKLIHSVNHLSRNAILSPFTNVSIFDRIKLLGFVEELSWYFPLDKLHIDDICLDELNRLIQLKQYIVDFIMLIQQIFLDFFDKGDQLKGGAPYRFPICTVNISKDGNNIMDKKFLNYICKKDIYRYNIFVSLGTKLASCCRLISDSEMILLAAQSNSFGGGGSIALGSHRVLTINLPRIAMLAGHGNKLKFFEILDERILSTIKILKAHKTLIWLLNERGLQRFIKLGWINMNRLFSTVGIIGTYLTLEISGISTLEFLTFINRKCLLHSIDINTKFNDNTKVITNIEQIPALSFAIRFALMDKLLFNKQDHYEMYSNQFIPLWKDCTIWLKMDILGKYNKLLTGGGIAHINIGLKTTSFQNKKIIEYAVKSGCLHFALNTVYSKCVDGHITMGKSTLCPQCSLRVVDYYTRVVGYFVPVSNFNKTRRLWLFPQRDYKSGLNLGL